MRSDVSEALLPAMVATAGYVITECCSWVLCAVDWASLTSLIQSIASHDLMLFWAGILVGWYAGRNWKEKQVARNGESAQQERQGKAASSTPQGDSIGPRNTSGQDVRL